MPTVNIPPRVRFVLYLAGALALAFVAYAWDKGWAGDPEVRLVTQLAALLSTLAAAKTDLSKDRRRRRRQKASSADPAAAIRERNRREGIS